MKLPPSNTVRIEKFLWMYFAIRFKKKIIKIKLIQSRPLKVDFLKN